MKKRIGLISLLVAVSGLIIIFSGIQFGLLKNPIWYIVLAGFEAGTIGGLADWFAVSALFREIPIPYIRKHTNIIVKNRQKLTLGVVDLVANKWLSPETIKEKISGLTIAENILQTILEPQNKNRAIDFLRDILNRFADNLDKPELAAILQKILKDQIGGIDLATPLGHWLENTIKKGEHYPLWEMILDTAHRTINDNSTRYAISGIVNKAARDYAEQGILKKFLVWAAETTGALDEQVVINKIVAAMNEFIYEAKNNPNHSVRQHFDNSILNFAQNLIKGDTNSHNIVNNLKKKIVENTEGQQIIQDILSKFKTTVKDELKSNNTNFMSLLTKYLTEFLLELQKDKPNQQKIDNWLKENIIQLVTKYHVEIGNMVKSSLERLKDFELVSQIEEKVGDDLQYIRLNGAVVGGFAGIVIAILKLIFTSKII